MINVKEILEKHNCYPDSQLQVKIADGKKGSIGERYNSAIREIIEEVLKEAANSAKVKEICEPNDQPSSSFGDDYYYIVNKKSITSVINKVKFD